MCAIVSCEHKCTKDKMKVELIEFLVEMNGAIT